jgi:hypothetical protein
VPCPSKAELRDRIAKMYKISNSKQVAVFGVKTGADPLFVSFFFSWWEKRVPHDTPSNPDVMSKVAAPG